MPESASDHNRQARAILSHAERMDPPESPPRELLTALVHSNLAVAEELKGIREGLTGFDALKIEDALLSEIQHVGREIIEIVGRANGGRS